MNSKAANGNSISWLLFGNDSYRYSPIVISVCKINVLVVCNPSVIKCDLFFIYTILKLSMPYPTVSIVLLLLKVA